MASGIQPNESRIPLTIGFRNQDPLTKAGIQYLESVIEGVESTIQECLGFPYIGRKNIKDPKCPSKIATIHLGSQWRRKFKTSIRKISPWLKSLTGHFDGLSVIAGTFSIQNRLNIHKEKRRKIRQSTINSLHLPQNMITLNTAAKNFIENRMP